VKRVWTQRSGVVARIAVAVVFMLAGNTARGAVAEFIGLGNAFMGAGMSAEGISGDGRVVVGITKVGETHFEAARWTREGGAVRLGAFAVPEVHNPFAVATAANADGSVIAGYGQTSNTTGEGFRWTASTGLVGIGALAGSNGAVVRGISADGSTIVGDSASRPFRWAASTGMVSLGEMSPQAYDQANAVSGDGSIVVGRGMVVPTHHAFRWTAATGLVRMDPADQVPPSEATAITPDGNTIVGWNYGLAGSHAFRWTEAGGFVSLDPAETPIRTTIPKALSADASTIVGIRQFADGQDMEPFVWDEVHGFRRMADILIAQGVDLSGWELREVKGISADGSTVVGYGIHNGSTESFVAVIVPEPGGFLLGTAGLWSMAVRRRR
jgi:uncharacterized membrane protein